MRNELPISTPEAARAFLEMGFAPIPVPRGSKAPVLSGWPKLQVTVEEVDERFEPSGNIGLLAGAPSGGLMDVDLDAPEAVAAGAILLPETAMVHGREGKPRSHYWYRVEEDPRSTNFKGPDGRMLLELRGTGRQTIVPPSLHPGGEQLVWHKRGQPEWVDCDDLLNACRKTAAAALLAQHWIKNGRQEAALALSGALHREGWPEHDIREFLRAVAEASGDEEAEKRLEAVRDTMEKLEQKRPATGLPQLRNLLGAEVVDHAFSWLFPDQKRRPRGPRLLRLVGPDELDQLPTLTWTLDSILPAGGLGVLYGEPGVGKTFLALDWALRVAKGYPWGGRPVKQGNVVYTASEGLAGMKCRIEVWRQHHGIHEGPATFALLTDPFQLRNSDEIDSLLETIRERYSGRLDLLVVDTLARATVGGDENSAKDMGMAIEALDRIRRETGSAVLLVHHSTKEGNRLRGSSALAGAVDTMMSLHQSKNSLHLRCEKQKDAPPFQTIALELKPVGESCLIMVGGTLHVPEDGLGKGAIELLMRLAEGSMKAGDSGLKRNTFYNHRRPLEERGFVVIEDGVCTITEEGLRLVREVSPKSPTPLRGGTMGHPETEALKKGA